MKKNKSKRCKKTILIAFKEGGENGGPYTSHRRILENYSSDEYILKPFFFPQSRVIFSPKGMKLLVQNIKKENAVAMHIVGLQLEGFVAMIACKLANVKIILAIHGSELEASKNNRLRKLCMSIIEKSTVKHSNIVFGVSDYVTSWKVCDNAQKLFGTIYNLPVDFNESNDLEPMLKEELKIKENQLVVVSTGRIIKDKGFDVLLEVIKRFKDDDKIFFVIAGDGSYREEMEKEIENYNLGKRVALLGYRSDIDNILSSSDIFIICTKHETLCISLQEAGAHKLPLIATNVGGIPEIIDQDCGILVENGDVDGFVEAIKVLECDSHLRTTMGNNAYHKVITKFCCEKILNQLDEVYKSVL